MSQSEKHLEVSTPAEVEYYFMVRPCRECGAGPWDIEESPNPGQRETLRVAARCRHCSARQSLEFHARNVPQQAVGGVDTINPDDTPSSLIDVAQWVALFRKFVEAASVQADKARARRLGYRAALCLEEALKFYGLDDEFPDAGAFFHESSREAYKHNPAMFERQHLRDMQARLPSLEVMESNLKRDLQRRSRKWWQFWKR
jgi:hypothetical protein